MPESSDSYFDLTNIERYEREREAVYNSVAEQEKRAKKRLKNARRVMTYGPIVAVLLIVAVVAFAWWV